MPINLSNIQPPKGSRKNRKRIGRGLGSKGTYSGRGAKGQKSRSGVSGLVALGMKRNILAIPKLRGFKSLREKAQVVNVGSLQALFDGKEPVTPKTLKNAGLVNASDRKIKILGEGELKKALSFVGVSVSQAAKEKILAAGGSIENK